jgi:hypothetical protein
LNLPGATPAEDILLPAFPVAQTDCGDQVYDLTQTDLVESRAGIVLWEDAFEGLVVPLDGGHGVVDKLADLRTLGVFPEVVPTCLRGNPKDIVSQILIAIFGNAVTCLWFPDEVFTLWVRAFLQQPIMLFRKSIGDVLEKNETEDDVFVFGGVHVAAQLVGGGRT